MDRQAASTPPCAPALVAPGIWKIRIGMPEAATAVSLRQTQPAIQAMEQLPAASSVPLDTAGWRAEYRDNGLVVRLPYPSSASYGLGLQLKSFDQSGKKKTLRVNSDPVADTGDSHAPVPFLLSVEGFGILVDTARYVTFYVASHEAKDAKPNADVSRGGAAVATSTDELYAMRSGHAGRDLVVFVPGVRGVDIYLFAGPTPKLAVQRYNLFSGGGCLPPMWGLGVWYRVTGSATQQQALDMARGFRERKIPCDVLGLEPGWHTHAYSCSYVWNAERFPQPDAMIQDLGRLGFHVNLWEHVFVHPSSPLHPKLAVHSGDTLVWGGLVPDLSIQQASDAFAAYHDETFVAHGISGFKLDECDNSDFIASPWSFPEHSRFPSGLDGEQMHSMLGILYQHCLDSAFRKHNRRTFSEVRSSHALASSYPFVLYSDLYDHRDFVRALANSGFTGLLWSPEVRDAKSVEDLVRRLQTVVLSPQALINAWYIKNPPWFQTDVQKNNSDVAMQDSDQVEMICRETLQLRMRLLPYIYSAFARYRSEGIPPFRALVLDYPEDVNCRKVDDQYLIGDGLLVAPLFADSSERDVYLPPGDWYCFHTHQRFEGGRSHHVTHDLRTIPVFVRCGTILPLAEPVDHWEAGQVLRVNPIVFGTPTEPASLFEDDGHSFNHENGAYNIVNLTWDASRGGAISRAGNYPGRMYEIGQWSNVI